uniref:Uncharacterized protein n=1 Tax=Romanomermis culicivorax TaxID=13658 RepID=A0A915ISP3_ROMCU
MFGILFRTVGYVETMNESLERIEFYIKYLTLLMFIVVGAACLLGLFYVFRSFKASKYCLENSDAERGGRATSTTVTFPPPPHQHPSSARYGNRQESFISRAAGGASKIANNNNESHVISGPPKFQSIYHRSNKDENGGDEPAANDKLLDETKICYVDSFNV